MAVMAGSVPGIEWMEARDTAPHSTHTRMAPTENELTPNVNSAGVEQPHSERAVTPGQMVFLQPPITPISRFYALFKSTQRLLRTPMR